MFLFFIDQQKHLEILDHVTTKWKDIIIEIQLFSTLYRHVVTIKGSDIVLSSTPLFPSCQSFDISKYWTFVKPIYHLFFKFKIVSQNNLRLHFEIEDRRRALVKRPLSSSSLAYEGDPIQFDLKKGKFQKYFLKISQRHSLESFSNCKNYPNYQTNGFTNYRECDEDFVYKEMKNKYKFMPFWAAKTMDEVTKIT